MFSEIFNYDNGFWRFMGKLWDALVLNILWMVCCIPLVTVGDVYKRQGLSAVGDETLRSSVDPL